MIELQVANWRIECDPDATRAAYAPLPIGTDCSCDQCRNFNAAAGKTFPPDFATLAASIGIDPSKPADLWHICREPSGLYLTNGMFHFVGHIVSGTDAIDFDTRNIQFQQLASGIEIGLTRNISRLPETFLSFGLALIQLEFLTYVPWVLTDVEPAP